MKFSKQIFYVIMTLVMLSCNKDNDDTSNVTNKIEFGNSLSIADELSYFSARVSTTITSLGGNTITQHGHCWNTGQNPTLEDLHSSLGSLSSASAFTSDLTELLPNTTYYIRAYLTHNNGTVYGSQISLKTLKTGKPDIETIDPTEIALFSAICGGEIVSDSGLVVTECGLIWGTDENSLSENYKDETTTQGTFTHKIENLDENTTYYVQAYAINEAGTEYGNKISFKTRPIVAPTVEITEILNVSTSSADCKCNVTDDGGAQVTERGVCWNTTESIPTDKWSTNHLAKGEGTGEYTGTITGLTDGTKYYVWAYAVNSKDRGYSAIDNFTTILITKPEVTTTDPTEITTNSAKCGGNVTSDGNGTVTERGVVWNEHPNHDPTIDSNDGKITDDDSGTGPFTSNITGLAVNTTYYVRAYATNEKGTSYGSEISFKTDDFSVPSVEVPVISYITTTSANYTCNVTDDGGTAITERGICWSTTSPPTTSDNHIADANNSIDEFNGTITGLAKGTTYYVRGYAINNKGSAYSAETHFETDVDPPTVSISYENLNCNSVTLKGNISDNGGVSITERGFYYGTSIDNMTKKPEGGSESGNYQSNLTSLSELTIYYIKAYAVNNKGKTGYSNTIDFTTPECPKPLIDEVVDTDVHDGDSDGGVGNDDAKVNVGEEIDLEVEIKNNGNATAYNIVGKLELFSSNDKSVCNITDSEETISSLAPGQSVELDDFDFDVSGMPDDGILQFRLTVTYEDEYGNEYSGLHSNGELNLNVYKNINEETCTPKNQEYWTGRVDSYQKIDEGMIVGRATLNVSRSWAKFDLSEIPDGATIKQVDLKFYVDVAATETTSFEIKFSVLTNDPETASRSTLRSDIISNSIMVCSTCGETIGYRTLQNITTLIDDVQNSLSKDWIAIGFYESNEDSDNCHIHGYSGNNPELIITYEY